MLIYFLCVVADVIVTGLRPDRIYQFRVAVINQVGWGEWSVNQTERTLGYGKYCLVVCLCV